LKKAAITFLLSFFLFSTACQALDIAIIVNPSGPLINATKVDVSDIYLGEKRFEGNIKIIPLLYPEGNIKDAFLREIVGMTPKEYKLYWTRKVFQEGLAIPKTLEHPGDIVKTVRNEKGGIGFLPKEMLKEIEGIKIIMVIGR
jgi:hypothetical protein